MLLGLAILAATNYFKGADRRLVYENVEVARQGNHRRCLHTLAHFDKPHPRGFITDHAHLIRNVDFGQELAGKESVRNWIDFWPGAYFNGAFENQV